ncbi:hypothetical protein Tco_0607671 [Tanacetum coccineum]
MKDSRERRKPEGSRRKEKMILKILSSMTGYLLNKGKGDTEKKRGTKGKNVVSAWTFKKRLIDVVKGHYAIEVNNAGRKLILEETPKKSKEQILQEEASLAEAIRLDSLQKEEEAKQIHLDSLLAQRIAEEEKLMSNRSQRKAPYPKRLKEEKDDEAKDDEPTKKSGKRRKQMARKGMHTSVDKNDSEDSDKVGEQEETVTGTETPINPVPVAMKTPSVATYKIIKQGEKGVYQIVREDGTDIVYINFGAMMKSISRDDLTEAILGIVNDRYGMDGPEDKLEKGFWKCLRIMFEEPLSTDSIWSEIGQQKIISWRYYDTCRVHCLNLESMDVYMLSDRKYPLSAEVPMGLTSPELRLTVDHGHYTFLVAIELDYSELMANITMLIADIEDDIMDPVMQCTTLPSHSGFSQKKLVSFVTEIHTTSIDFLTLKHPSDTYVLTMKMEILLEPASNKLLVGNIKLELGDAPHSAGV